MVVFFWGGGGGGGEDVDRNWQIIRGPLGQFGGNMELLRIIWVPSRDHYGSVGVNMVYWGLLGNHLGVRGSVGVSGIYWASEGLGSFGVREGSLDVSIYHSRDLYILRYIS